MEISSSAVPAAHPELLRWARHGGDPQGQLLAPAVGARDKLAANVAVLPADRCQPEYSDLPILSTGIPTTDEAR